MGRLNRARPIVAILLGALLLVSMFWYVGIERVIASFREASPYWLSLAFAASLPPFLIRAWRWRLLLSPVKKSVRYSNALGITFVGFLANALVPVRLGEFLRAFLMQKREGIGFFQAFSSIVVERILDLLTIVTLGTVALFLLPPQQEYVGLAVNIFRVAGILSTLALIILFVGVREREKLMSATGKVVSRIPLLSTWKEKICRFVEELIQGAEGISYGFTSTSLLIAESLALWTFTALQIHFLFNAFSINLSPVAVLAGAMLFNLSFALPAPPGGVGSFEAFWSIIFVSLGVPMVEALSTGIAAHMMSFAFTVLTGGLTTAWYGVSFKDFSVAKGFEPARVGKV